MYQETIVRREWSLVALWTLVVLAVVMAPVWHGYHQADSDSQFVGFVGRYHNDYHSYLAWIRQAYDGHALFRNMYTTEPHGRVFFHPLFWLMGALSRGTGVSFMVVWHVVQGLGCMLMIGVLYRFFAFFTDNKATRFLALVLSTTASGFGWMVNVEGTPWLEWPIDLWLVEANQFQAMVTSFFTLPIALGLMLLAMVWSLRYFESGRLRDALIGGIFALGLAAVHPYDVIVLYAVLALWTLLEGRKRFAGMILLVAVSIPFIIYSLVVVTTDPVLSQVKWYMPVPPLVAHVVGWGLPFFLCISSFCIPEVRRQNRRIGLLAIWLLAVAILMLLPIDFKRKLIWGVHVPMCLLTAMVVHWLWEKVSSRIPKLPARKAISFVFAMSFVSFCAIGSFVSYVELFKRNERNNFSDYITDTYLEAMSWLDDNSEHGEVVLATPAVKAMLPGRTGNTVFVGHWAQTIDGARKRAFVDMMFGPPEMTSPKVVNRILSRNRVRYILLDSMSLRMNHLPETLPDYVFIRFSRLVFRNDDVAIWQLNNYQQQSDVEVWPSGDWRGNEGVLHTR